MAAFRDDGAAVYLNGREIYRDNLQAGPVSFNSLALRTLDPPEEFTPVEVVLATMGHLPTAEQRREACLERRTIRRNGRLPCSPGCAVRASREPHADPTQTGSIPLPPQSMSR